MENCSEECTGLICIRISHIETTTAELSLLSYVSQDGDERSA